MPQIIDGKQIAMQIKEELKERVARLKQEGKSVCLAVIQVGNDPASTVYVNGKKKDCAYIGIESRSYELPEETKEEELLALLDQLNHTGDVHGILVQLPLPSHMDESKVVKAIDPAKDVDGFHPVNIGKLCIGGDGFDCCTPAGVIQLLKRSGISIRGRECVVVGRSNNVGKPTALLLLRENGTVTIAHSQTKDLKEITKRADILVAAVAGPEAIAPIRKLKEYIKENAVVIDVGIHRNEDNVLCGDVDYDDVIEKVGAITPVPGGVGPMTRAMLMYNCVEAACK